MHNNEQKKIKLYLSQFPPPSLYSQKVLFFLFNVLIYFCFLKSIPLPVIILQQLILLMILLFKSFLIKKNI